MLSGEGRVQRSVSVLDVVLQVNTCVAVEYGEAVSATDTRHMRSRVVRCQWSDELKHTDTRYVQLSVVS